MHPRIVIARPQRGRGALSAKREEVPLGCNLGKALTARTNHRRPHALPNLTVAAVSDRLVQSHSTAGGHWCTAALPDVSLRGAKRRGNLAVHSWITGRPRRKRNFLPEIAPQGHFLALRAQGATSAVRPPRNDKPSGMHRLTASLFIALVRRRAGRAPPVQRYRRYLRAYFIYFRSKSERI